MEREGSEKGGWVSRNRKEEEQRNDEGKRRKDWGAPALYMEQVSSIPWTEHSVVGGVFY